MLRKIILATPFLLAACDAPQPMQPPPAVQKLLDACNAGDLRACVAAENARQAELQRRASIPRPVLQSTLQNPSDFQTSRPQQQTVCRNSFGQVICTTN